jgi:hypothetical protein
MAKEITRGTPRVHVPIQVGPILNTKNAQKVLPEKMVNGLKEDRELNTLQFTEVRIQSVRDRGRGIRRN